MSSNSEIVIQILLYKDIEIYKKKWNDLGMIILKFIHDAGALY